MNRIEGTRTANRITVAGALFELQRRVIKVGEVAEIKQEEPTKLAREEIVARWKKRQPQDAEQKGGGMKPYVRVLLILYLRILGMKLDKWDFKMRREIQMAFQDTIGKDILCQGTPTPDSVEYSGDIGVDIQGILDAHMDYRSFIINLERLACF